MKRWIAILLHGLAYRLAPELAVWERQLVILELAEEHRQQERQRQEQLAKIRRHAAEIARNN